MSPERRVGPPLIEWRDLKVGWSMPLDLPTTWTNGRLFAGDRALLVGPNACGKSTLLRALSGAGTDLDGEVLIRGRRLPKSATPDVYLGCGLARVPQDTTIFEALTVGENADLLLGEAGPVRRGPFCGWIEERRHETLFGASGGERQIIALERAWRSGAEILLLDEPWNVLDQDACRALDRGLAEFPGAVLAIRHLSADDEEVVAGWTVLPYSAERRSPSTAP